MKLPQAKTNAAIVVSQLQSNHESMAFKSMAVQLRVAADRRLKGM